MAAECEIEVNGKPCGVQAVGRCATCGKAFCTTHQARTTYHPPAPIVSYVDMCAPCFAKSPQEVARVEKAMRQQETYDAKKYFESGTARIDLLASGVQPVTIYKFEIRTEETRTGIFGRRSYEHREMNVPFGRGWILSTISWYPSSTSANSNFVTALLDVPVSSNNTAGLVRVESCPEGYRLVRDYSSDVTYMIMFTWVDALEAVKKLTGSSSQPTP